MSAKRRAGGTILLVGILLSAPPVQAYATTGVDEEGARASVVVNEHLAAQSPLPLDLQWDSRDYVAPVDAPSVSTATVSEPVQALLPRTITTPALDPLLERLPDRVTVAPDLAHARAAYASASTVATGAMRTLADAFENKGTRAVEDTYRMIYHYCDVDDTFCPRPQGGDANFGGCKQQSDLYWRCERSCELEEGTRSLEGCTGSLGGVPSKNGGLPFLAFVGGVLGSAMRAFKPTLLSAAGSLDSLGRLLERDLPRHTQRVPTADAPQATVESPLPDEAPSAAVAAPATLPGLQVRARVERLSFEHRGPGGDASSGPAPERERAGGNARAIHDAANAASSDARAAAATAAHGSGVPSLAVGPSSPAGAEVALARGGAARQAPAPAGLLWLAAGALAVALLAGLHRLRSQQELLDQTVRSRMLEALADPRGRTAGELAAVTGVCRTTARYHLRLLRAQGIVAVQRVGKRVVFVAPGGSSPDDVRAARALSNDAARRVLSILARNPSASLRHVAAQCGLAPSGAHWHVRELERHGLLARRREGRGATYLLSEAAWRHVDPAAALRPSPRSEAGSPAAE